MKSVSIMADHNRGLYLYFNCEITLTNNYCSEVSIILEAEADGEVELDVSYVVSNARWTPVYDLRVFTDGDAKVMKVCEYK
jgi:hypothetical protein